MDETIYTPIGSVVDALRKRQQDVTLKAKVLDYLEHAVPPPLTTEGLYAVLCRHVATPNYEFKEFISFSSDIGARPVVLEHTEDKFTSRNEDKLALARICLSEPTYSPEKPVCATFELADVQKHDGSKISEVNTLRGQSLVEVHHRMAFHYWPEVAFDTVNISGWLYHFGSRASEYYTKELALFLTHGILFENYRDYGSESRFVREVVRPAITTLESLFGYKPLICPLQPFIAETNPRWTHYPSTQQDAWQDFM